MPVSQIASLVMPWPLPITNIQMKNVKMNKCLNFIHKFELSVTKYRAMIIHVSRELVWRMLTFKLMTSMSSLVMLSVTSLQFLRLKSYVKFLMIDYKPERILSRWTHLWNSIIWVWIDCKLFYASYNYENEDGQVVNLCILCLANSYFVVLKSLDFFIV